MNERREPFRKFKELRISLGTGTHEVKLVPYTHDRNTEQISDMVSNVSITPNTGIVLTIKETGKHVHVKYNNHTFDYALCSAVLIFKDVELYTPFVYDPGDKTHKWISWEEWNEKYNAEAICKRITTVTDEHLKEHDTDLMYILDKLCSCAADRTFDHPYRFVKVEPRYQDNEYSLHRVAADFRWLYSFKMSDYIRYLFEYTAKNRTIHIDILKHATYDIPSNIFSSPFLANTVPDDFKVNSYSIDVEFNKDYSISNVTVKNKNKENLLKFMEMGSPVIKNTIRQIRDYINAKLTEKQLSSRINVTNENNKYAQTWNFSPRVDVRPYTESIRKANECAKAYNIDTDVEATEYSTIWEYLNTKMTGLNAWMIKEGEPFKFEYNYGPFKKTEIVNVRTVENNSFINLLLQSTDMRAIETVYNMEITITFDDIGNIKDYAMINKELIDKFEEKNIINLLKFLEEMCPGLCTFTLNKYGDIYNQLKNECDSIYNHSTDCQNKTSTCNGYVLSLSSGTFMERTREKIYFHFEGFATFHNITIEVLDPKITKLKVTLGIEDSQLVSIAVNPSFDKFDAVINTIYNPRVKRLVSEIFNKLYKGEENN